MADRETPRPTLAAIRRAFATQEHQLANGSRLGRYQLLDKIGEGAFGEVWRAEDTSSTTTAAVKIFARSKFNPDAVHDAAERFHDGVAAMRKLHDAEHVVHVLEGPSVDEKGGHLWFAMEYFPARDLGRWLGTTEVDFKARLDLISDVLGALTTAHDLGIVHRDVRPGNILISTDGTRPRAFLTDFDIAYYEDMLRQRDTTKFVVGVSRYIPREVFGASRENLPRLLRRPQNDLYALAVVTLDLFSTAELDLPPRAEQLANAIPARSRKVPNGLPRTIRKPLVAFLQRALGDSRFQTAGQYARQWTTVRAPQPVRTVVIALAGAILTTSMVVLADWLWFLSTSKPTWSRIASLFLALSATGSCGLTLSWLVSTITSRMPLWRQWAHSAALAFPRLALLVPTVLTLIAAVVAAYSDLPRRVQTARLVVGTDCFAVSSNNTYLFGVSEEQMFPVLDVARLKCRNSGEVPQLQGLSLATRVPTLEAALEPNARVRVSGISGTTQLRLAMGQAQQPLTLARVDAFTGPLVPSAPQGLLGDPKLRGDLLGAKHVLVTFRRNQDTGTVSLGDVDVGMELLRKGLLTLGRDDEPSDSYRAAQTTAKERGLGLWGPIVLAEKRQELAARCPEKCCSGVSCEDMATCESRAKCVLCRDGRDRRALRLSLAALNFERLAEWTDVRVCLTTRNNCNQECISTSSINHESAELTCVFHPRDLAWTELLVIGKRQRDEPDIRIAEKQKAFGLIGPDALCQGLAFKSMVDRKGHVQSVYFSARLEGYDHESKLEP
jgi:serine/threonine protein kinase